jgi:D-alanine-D-alanine ligase-like ATP-grasp enzyme
MVKILMRPGWYLRPMLVDDVLVGHLSRQGVSLDAVVPVGQHIALRSNANLSTGWCVDVTSSVHPQVRLMAESLAQSLGLATSGVDYISPDVSRPRSELGGAFIEINATPEFDALIAAGFDPVWVGRQVLGPVPGRIPVTLAVVESSALVAL